MASPEPASYASSIGYLENLYRTPHLASSVVELERAEFLLRRLGNPHRAFRSVHIAGSTGKGSTTSMVAEILACAGHRTGAFRSPHLVTYRERITLGGEEITEGDWLRAFALVLPVVEAMRTNALPDYNLGRPALFEVLFAMACVHFALEGIDWAVIETGLGGRLDATNLLQSDVAAVTNISLEHTQILGATLREIAHEKAAIIKRGSAAVTGESDVEALDVIERRAASVGSPLLEVGRDIDVESGRFSAGAQRITLSCGSDNVAARLPLAGRHQLFNAAVAFGVSVVLRCKDVHVPLAAVSAGLERVRIPGRMERYRGRPEMILDGAHNPAGFEALAETLEELGPAPTTLLFAAMDDKNIEEMARLIAPCVQCVVVTEVPGTERTSGRERIQMAFGRAGVPTLTAPSADSGLTAAKAVTPPEGRIVVAGSMYLVGAVRAGLERIRA